MVKAFIYFILHEQICILCILNRLAFFLVKSCLHTNLLDIGKTAFRASLNLKFEKKTPKLTRAIAIASSCQQGIARLLLWLVIIMYFWAMTKFLKFLSRDKSVVFRKCFHFILHAIYQIEIFMIDGALNNNINNLVKTVSSTFSKQTFGVIVYHLERYS